MTLEQSGTQTITLEPANIQQIMELSRDHDELLKDARQDLIRAETHLKLELQWRWPLLAASAGAGALALTALQTPAVMLQVRDLLGGIAGYVARVATSVLVVGGISLPVFVVALVAIGLAIVIGLAAAALRRTSSRRTASRLMKAFAGHDDVSAAVFGEDSVADVADSISGKAEPRASLRPVRVQPAIPSLAVSLAGMLHRATFGPRLALVD